MPALIIGLLGSLLGSAANAQPPQYTVTNLGTLGGTESQALAINNRGQVVGYATTTGNTSARATLFSGTGTGNLDLGNLGGPANFGSRAYGISDSEQIIGTTTAPSGFVRATLFSGTGADNLDLGNLGGSTGSFGQAINNSGQIVGLGDTGLSAHAALFSGTGSGNVDLGSLGGASSIAYGINSSGQIVGQANNTSQIQRATLFSGTGAGNLDLGALDPS